MSLQSILSISGFRFYLFFTVLFSLSSCNDKALEELIVCKEQQDLNYGVENLKNYLNNASSLIKVVEIDNAYKVEPFDESKPYKDRNITLELNRKENQFLIDNELNGFSEFDSILKSRIYEYLLNKNYISTQNKINQNLSINSGLVFEIRVTNKGGKTISNEQALEVLTLLKAMDCTIDMVRNELAETSYDDTYLNLTVADKEKVQNALPKHFYVYQLNFDKIPLSVQ